MSGEKGRRQDSPMHIIKSYWRVPCSLQWIFFLGGDKWGQVRLCKQLVFPDVASKKTMSRVLVQYDKDGAPVNQRTLVQAKGFRDGCMIQRLDDTVAKIIAVDKDGVTMLIECEKPYQAKASLQSFLDGEWKLKKTHAQELVPWTTACQPSVSKEFFFACVKAQVQMEMFEQLKMPKMKHFLGLEIYKGPRDVKVSRSFKSGELVIPCSTCKVVIAPEVKDALVIGQCSHGGDTFLVALAPLTQWPKEDDESGFLNPFWLLPESCEKDEASCEIQDIKLSQDISPTSKVLLPVIKNLSLLEAGDSCVLFKENKKKRMSPLEAVDPPKKRIKPKK